MVNSGLYQGYVETGGDQYEILQYPLMSITGNAGYPPIFGYSRKVLAGDRSLIPSATVTNVPIPNSVFAPGIDYVRNTLPGDLASLSESYVPPDYAPRGNVYPLTSIFDTALNVPDMRANQGMSIKMKIGLGVAGLVIMAVIYLKFIRKKRGPII
jgi:hypothetical protein